MENETAQTKCPKCGGENPNNARFCCSCGYGIVKIEATSQTISVKVSKVAIAAFVGALCGLALIMPILIAVGQPRSRPSGRDREAFLVGVIVLGVAVILGLVSVIRIERSGGRITGRVFAVGAVLIGVLGLLVLPVWVEVAASPRSVAFRMTCGTNLSGIGKAMLIYSNDYDNEFPRAGGVNSIWAQRIPDWKASNRFQAYGLSRNFQGGVGTISSCFYLLVKYSELDPKRLLCNSEPKAKPFDPAKSGVRNRDLIELWDFGPEPWKHVSYSYHMPFGPYALTTSDDPGMAVAADRNPWIDSPFVGYRKDFSKFAPESNREALRAGNTIGHHEDGQNVLFLDSHVNFEKKPYVGVNDDNIYTFWDGEDIRRGEPPVMGSQPQGRLDSLLVHDPPLR